MTLITSYPAFKPVNLHGQPVRGQDINRKKIWLPFEREFLAADLRSGTKILVDPTLAQAKFLTGAGSVSGVWWAVQRKQHRQEILAGLMPLVPPQTKKCPPLSDNEVVNFVRRVGIGRVLDAAVAVEAAE